MSFEVDAFMSVSAAPPPRASQSAPAPETGPSFDDHLNEASAPETKAKAEAKPRAEEAEENDVNAEPAAVPQAPANTAPPVVIQLIASAESIPIEPAPAEASATPAMDAHPPAASPPADIAIAPDAPRPEVGAEAQDANEAVKTPDSADAKAHIEPAKSDAPKAAATDQDVAISNEPSAAPTQETTQQPQAQAIAQAPVIAIMPQPTQNADKRAAAQGPAIAAEAKSNGVAPRAPLSDAKSAQAAKPTEPQADTAKSNTPQSTGKDSFSAMLADAPEAPAPSSSSSAALTSAALATSSAQTSHHTQETATAASRAGPITDQVGREIIRRFNGGSTFFELRLDPPEMGRIEVRLEVSRDHRVTAVVAADNPQALADLARHARDLETALQSAGLELSDQGLSFDLSQQRESRADAEEARNGRRGALAEGETPQSATPLARPIGLERWRGVRVDVMA